MPSIGDTLRAARRRQGRALADAAAETRVRESYLAALEQEDFDVLGGDVYVRGFIRLYARYLGLEPEALVDAYRNEHERPAEAMLPPAGLEPLMPVSDPAARSRRIAIGVAAGVVVVLLLYLAGRGGDEPATNPGPEPVTTPTLLLESLPDVAATDPAPPAAAEPEITGEPFTSLEVLVTVTGESARLRVTQGDLPIDATLEQGAVREFGGDEAVVFEVDDAAAVDVQVNGEPLLDLGESGQAVEVTCRVGEVACVIRDV